MLEADSSTESSEPVSKGDRYIETTQTGRYAIDADGADEELNGFTTTREESAGRLENPVPDEPDPDIIATTTTTWFTTTKETTTKKSAAKSSKTTKQQKKLLSLLINFMLPLSVKSLKSKKKYKVTSDTTYLNLRYGPSKKYEGSAENTGRNNCLWYCKNQNRQGQVDLCYI